VVDSTDPPHQAGSDMDRSPTGYEGLCVVNIPDCPNVRPTSTDLERITSKKSLSPPRQTDRTVLKGIEPPLYHTPDHSLTPTKKSGRGQLPGPIAHDPEGLILDSNSATTGFAKFTCTAASESDMQREEQLSEKYGTRATDISTLRKGGTKTALPEALGPETAEMKGNEPEPTPTQAD